VADVPFDCGVRSARTEAESGHVLRALHHLRFIDLVTGDFGGDDDVPNNGD